MIKTSERGSVARRWLGVSNERLRHLSRTLASYPSTTVDIPLSTVLTMGVFSGLAALSCWLVPQPSESRDWLFLALLGAGYPAIHFGLLARWKSARVFFAAAGALFFAAMLILGTADLTERLFKGANHLAWFSRQPPPVGLLLLASLASVCCLVDFWLTIRFTRWLDSSAGAAAPDEGRRSGVDFAILFFLVYCLLTLSDNDFSFFWLRQKYGATYPMLVLLFWYCRRVFYRSPGTPLTSRFDRVDWLWLGIFLFFCRIPFVPFSDPRFLYHHWSFYVGPLWTVKHGGVLLYDTPSQYGFLSLWLPAILPFPPASAFGLAIVAVVAVQAVLLYRLFRSLPWWNGDRVLPGLLTLACTFFLGGGRTYLGIFESPSVSGYRFFWSFALCWVLMSNRLAHRRLAKNVLISVIGTVGCLWSIESALYCIGTLGIAWLAETILALRGSTTARTACRDLILWPGAALALGIGGVALWYRHAHGVLPDWYAFAEYALAYKAGYGALPIHFTGAVVSALCLMALSVALLTFSLREERSALSGGRFACWGFFITTLTYYTSRSHPSNICNLLAFWFPIFCLLVRETRLPESSRRNLRPVLCTLTAMVLLATYFNYPSILKGTFEMVERPTVPAEKTLHAWALDWPKATRLRAQLVPQVPTLDLSMTLPELSLASFQFTPFPPAYPISEFTILPAERQTRYLTRYLAAHPVPAFQLIRTETAPPDSPDAILIPWIHDHFRLTRERRFEGLVIEDYASARR